MRSGSYRRILALIDFDDAGRDVARQAWNLARLQNARLALGHVVDWGQGFDDFMSLTPSELEACLRVEIRKELRTLATTLGAKEASTLVASRGAEGGLAEMVRDWQPDLLVVKAGTEYDSSSPDAGFLEVPGWRCAVAALHPQHRPFPVVHGLAARILRSMGLIADRLA